MPSPAHLYLHCTCKARVCSLDGRPAEDCSLTCRPTIGTACAAASSGGIGPRGMASIMAVMAVGAVWGAVSCSDSNSSALLPMAGAAPSSSQALHGEGLLI